MLDDDSPTLTTHNEAWLVLQLLGEDENHDGSDGENLAHTAPLHTGAIMAADISSGQNQVHPVSLSFSSLHMLLERTIPRLHSIGS